MLQRPNGKCGAQFREDGSPDDIVSALQCPVVSHQQGVVERKGQSFPSLRYFTKLLKDFYIHLLKRSIFYLQMLDTSTVP